MLTSVCARFEAKSRAYGAHGLKILPAPMARVWIAPKARFRLAVTNVRAVKGRFSRLGLCDGQMQSGRDGLRPSVELTKVRTYTHFSGAGGAHLVP